MKSSHWIFPAFALALLLNSCTKEENPPISIAEMWNCHNKIIWDTSNTKNSLLGEWEWEYVKCYYDPESVDYHSSKGMTVEFKSNNTVEVKTNDQEIQTSKWKVENGDGDLFEVKTDPPIPQLQGGILFCKKRVAFNLSYIDGCNHYFIKKR